MSKVSIDEGHLDTRARREHGVSPSVPMVVEPEDLENLPRFPYGYPHVVQLRDHEGEDVFAVRMRMLNGGFDVIGDTTPDLASAQKSLAGLIRQLTDARWRGGRWEDDEDILAAYDAAWPDKGARETSFDRGRADFAWPHLNYQNMDRELLAMLPERCPLVVEYELGEGAKKYAAAYKRGRGISGIYYWRSDYGHTLADIQWLGVSNMGVWEKHIRPELEPDRMSPSPR